MAAYTPTPEQRGKTWRASSELQLEGGGGGRGGGEDGEEGGGGGGCSASSAYLCLGSAAAAAATITSLCWPGVLILEQVERAG